MCQAFHIILILPWVLDGEPSLDVFKGLMKTIARPHSQDEGIEVQYLGPYPESHNDSVLTQGFGFFLSDLKIYLKGPER